jgi:hypothetical protein
MLKPWTVQTNVEPWDLRGIRDEAFAMIAAMNEADRSAIAALEVSRLMLGWCEYLAKRERTWADRQAWAGKAARLRAVIPNVEAAAAEERYALH